MDSNFSAPFVPLATGAVSNATLLGWIKSYAYINSTNQISASGTECPAAFRYNAGNLYSASYDTAAQNLNAQIKPAKLLHNKQTTIRDCTAINIQPKQRQNNTSYKLKKKSSN